MRITVNGTLRQGVTSKDLILYIISAVSTGGATGYFVEYAGEAISRLSMEARMTVCNMSIEMGARGGLIAPDDVTFGYLSDIPSFSSDPDAGRLIEKWCSLLSDRGALFDKEIAFDASSVPPMITWGTNPGMSMAIDGVIPAKDQLRSGGNGSYLKALDYMGFKPGMRLLGHPVDYVFLGSCTNGRIEDLRAFASVVEGRKKAPGVTVLIVPGSQQVARQAEKEGLTDIFKRAGFAMRQPGCSSCLAMNDDKIPAGKYAVSTSNRNFEGRQGPGARTILAGPLTAAAAAVKGRITDPRELMRVCD
jgi:3-isopropylmalate/(R)-2-methylmalate dehydratase large subunit